MSYVLCLMSATCVKLLESVELLHRAIPDNHHLCLMSHVLCLMSATCVKLLESVELLHRAIPDNHHFILHQRDARAKHSNDTEPEPDCNQPSAHAFTSQYLYFCTTVSICTFVLVSKYFCASKASAPVNFAVVPHPVQIHIYMLTYADVC
jgi:ATP/ADP translocase